MRCRHGRANRAVAGEAARDGATAAWRVRLRLETARRAAQPADPGAGQARQQFHGLTRAQGPALRGRAAAADAG